MMNEAPYVIAAIVYMALAARLWRSLASKKWASVEAANEEAKASIRLRKQRSDLLDSVSARRSVFLKEATKRREGDGVPGPTYAIARDRLHAAEKAHSDHLAQHGNIAAPKPTKPLEPKTREAVAAASLTVALMWPLVIPAVSALATWEALAHGVTAAPDPKPEVRRADPQRIAELEAAMSHDVGDRA